MVVTSYAFGLLAVVGVHKTVVGLIHSGKEVCMYLNCILFTTDTTKDSTYTEVTTYLTRFLYLNCPWVALLLNSAQLPLISATFCFPFSFPGQ